MNIVKQNKSTEILPHHLLTLQYLISALVPNTVYKKVGYERRREGFVGLCSYNLFIVYAYK